MCWKSYFSQILPYTCERDIEDGVDLLELESVIDNEVPPSPKHDNILLNDTKSRPAKVNGFFSVQFAVKPDSLIIC